MSQEIDPTRPRMFVLILYSGSVRGCDVAVVGPGVMMVVSSLEMTSVDVRSQMGSGRDGWWSGRVFWWSGRVFLWLESFFFF